VMKYGFGDDRFNWIAIVHGWAYFVYLLFAANLAVKVRWPLGKTVVLFLTVVILFKAIIYKLYTQFLDRNYG
jgi:integral membrane protein